MRILDLSLFVALLAGNVLALSIWWKLFGAPFVQVWRKLNSQIHETAERRLQKWKDHPPEGLAKDKNEQEGAAG